MLVREFAFRGAKYAVAHIETFAQHPSWFSFEDEAVVRDRWWHIQPGDVVFDIGANYGSYTLTALALGAARVYAWSPQENEPSEADFMRASLRLNKWTDRCEIEESGLYDRDGWLDTYSQVFLEHKPEPCPNTTIQVGRLDSWRKGKSIAAASRYWLKIDVEGAELEVFRGGEGLIREFRPAVLIENHNFKRASLEREARDYLTALGYREVGTVPYHSVSHSLYLP